MACANAVAPAAAPFSTSAAVVIAVNDIAVRPVALLRVASNCARLTHDTSAANAASWLTGYAKERIGNAVPSRA